MTEGESKSARCWLPGAPEKRPALVAMIHLGALPGTPYASIGSREIAQQAAREARLYRDCGVDALLIENMQDRPYLNRNVGPEITAAMTQAGLSVREAVPDLPIGIQVLAGANREALAIASVCGFSFIRAEGFVFGHLADEGWMDAQAGALLRYRRHIGAEQVAIWADIQKKHAAHAVSADITLEDWARETAFAGADALILTGRSTGLPAEAEALNRLRGLSTLPLIIGSGLDPENAAAYRSAHAWIVGSSLKVEGRWNAAPDPLRVQAMVRAAQV